MAHQSLYRRYRSQNFAEIKGQAHVTKALQTAVAEGRHSHAYLFSGPRGTGKTSTARVLAKALNCENLTDGEPCGVCKSCLDIQNGTSFDLHELDAASNNKVDDIRELIGKVALGSPGRTKVYILDEVHMLTSGAENALLKTLEEPPEHVVFVLATTEPHKVVATIKSRTQHFEFKLLPGEELAEHLRYVIADAGLAVDEAGIDYALRQGGGSARDTLSALDLVAAAGGVPEGSDVGFELALAVGAGDAAATMLAVETAIEGGREPRIIGELTVDMLRNAFLASMGAPLAQLNDAARAQARDVAEQVGPATLTRSLEMLGQALVDMRQAPDARVPLEVALLRLSRRDGNDLAALAQRVEHLEAELRRRGSVPEPVGAAASAPTPGAEPSMPATPAGSARPAPTEPTPTAVGDTRRDAPPPPVRRRAPADAARAGLVEPAPSPTAQPEPTPTAATAPAPEPASTAPPSAPDPTGPGAGNAPAPTGSPLSIDTLVAAFEAGLLDDVSQRTRVRFGSATPLSVDATSGVATFGVPNTYYVPRCDEVKGEVETALSAHFARPLTVSIVVDENPMGSTPAAPTGHKDPGRTPDPGPVADDEDVGDVTELADANDVAGSGLDRLTQAFPGSQVIDGVDHR